MLQEGPNHTREGDETDLRLLPPRTFDEPISLDSVVDETLQTSAISTCNVEAIQLVPCEVSVAEECFGSMGNEAGVGYRLVRIHWSDLGCIEERR